MIRLLVGPPGAGKTTYAQEHAADTDQIIDLDEIRARGLTEDDAQAERLRLERAAADYQDGDVWVIRTLADPADRADFERRHRIDQTVVLDPGDDICLDRIHTRDGNDDKADGIRRWRQHNPTPQEEQTVTTHTTDDTDQTTPTDTPQRSRAAQEPQDDAEAPQEATDAPEGEQEPQEPEKPSGNRAAREAAKYRNELRAAEAKLAAMQESIDTAQRREVEQLAIREQLVHKPAALWKLGLELDDLRDETGNIDVDKARAGVKQIRMDFGLEGYKPPRPTHQGYKPFTGGDGGWADSFDPES